MLNKHQAILLINFIFFRIAGSCSSSRLAGPEIELDKTSLYASDHFGSWMDRRSMDQFALSCGKSNGNKRKGKIYHGNVATPGQFPWMVAIIIKQDNDEKKSYFIKCSGQIIDPRYVLTAAHCLAGYNKVLVLTGYFDIRNRLNSSRLIKMEQSIIHKDFREIKRGNSSLAINDIALLKVSKPFNFKDPDIGMACLPVFGSSMSKGSEFKLGNQVTIMGFGVKENGKTSCCLQFAEGIRSLGWQECLLEIESVPFIDSDVEHLFGLALNKGTLCTVGADSQFATSCMGDSGGGLYYMTSDKTYYLLGLTSFGWDTQGKCNSIRPVIYTDVKEKLDWIMHNMKTVDDH